MNVHDRIPRQVDLQEHLTCLGGVVAPQVRERPGRNFRDLVVPQHQTEDVGGFAEPEIVHVRDVVVDQVNDAQIGHVVESALLDRFYPVRGQVQVLDLQSSEDERSDRRHLVVDDAEVLEVVDVDERLRLDFLHGIELHEQSFELVEVLERVGAKGLYADVADLDGRCVLQRFQAVFGHLVVLVSLAPFDGVAHQGNVAGGAAANEQREHNNQQHFARCLLKLKLHASD